MSDLEKEKFLPTGLGREAEPKETLPAIEVDNQVIWVNPDFPETPFDLKEGEPTKLGFFLTPEKSEKSFSLKVDHQHRRSALLGRVILKDTQGRLYRDIDLKGIGHCVPGMVGKIERMGPESITGILDKDYGLYAKDMAEKFLEAGIRTERYLALTELREIIDEHGDKISIDEARKRKIIPNKIEPVIGIRAFGTKYRIRDVIDNVGDVNTTIMRDARKLVSQECGLKERNFTPKKYFEWFAQTLGENIGLMHKNEWYHAYLTPHNITLDCRIVDLDSADSFHSKDEGIKKERMNYDWTEAKGSLYSLYRVWSFSISGKPKERSYSVFEKIFNESYIKNLGYKPSFITE